MVLPGLQIELLEMVVSYLDIKDACSLRLASAQLAANILACRTFSEHLASKNVELTKSGLEQFVRMTEAGQLGTKLRRCRLTAVVRPGDYVPEPEQYDDDSSEDDYHTSEDEEDEGEEEEEEREDDDDDDNEDEDDSEEGDEEEQTDEHISLIEIDPHEDQTSDNFWPEGDFVIDEMSDDERLELTQLLGKAFSNLQRNSPAGKLESLTLLAKVNPLRYPDPRHFAEWHIVWATALRGFRMAMGGLQISRLPIAELSLYDKLACCSLECDEFFSVFGVPQGGKAETDEDAPDRSWLEPVFGGLKKLSGSFSPAAAMDGDEPIVDYGNLDALAQWRRRPVRIVPDFVPVLQHMPSLTHLSLHWYLVTFDPPYAASLTVPNAIISKPPTAAKLPSLESLTLLGVPTSETDLLWLLRAVKPASVQFEDVALLDSKWSPQIMRYLAGDDGKNKAEKTPVPKVHLRHLRQGTREHLVFFDIPGQPTLTYTRGDGINQTAEQLGPNSLEWDSAVESRYVRAHASDEQPFADRKRQEFVQSEGRRYGPPWIQFFDFSKQNRQFWA